MTAIGSGYVSDTGRRNDAASGAAGWLALAAAPVFLLMAVLTAFGGGAPDMMCAMQGSSSLTGMVPMYLLMSAFHAAPWLRLMSGRVAPQRR